MRRVADVRASRSSYTKSRNTVRDRYNLPGFLVAASCDCIVPEVSFGFSCTRLKHRDGVVMVIFVCCFGCFSFLTKCKTVSFFTYFFRRNKICQQYTYLRENRYLLVFCYECRSQAYLTVVCLLFGMFSSSGHSVICHWREGHPPLVLEGHSSWIWICVCIYAWHSILNELITFQCDKFYRGFLGSRSQCWEHSLAFYQFPTRGFQEFRTTTVWFTFTLMILWKPNSSREQNP